MSAAQLQTIFLQAWIKTAHGNLAAIRHVEAAKQMQQRTLARTTRAPQRDHRAGANFHADAVEHRHAAGIVGFF